MDPPPIHLSVKSNGLESSYLILYLCTFHHGYVCFVSIGIADGTIRHVLEDGDIFNPLKNESSRVSSDGDDDDHNHDHDDEGDGE